MCLRFSFSLTITYEYRAADADKPMSGQSVSKCLMEICSTDGYVPFVGLSELVILLNHAYSVDIVLFSISEITVLILLHIKIYTVLTMSVISRNTDVLHERFHKPWISCSMIYYYHRHLI